MTNANVEKKKKEKKRKNTKTTNHTLKSTIAKNKHEISIGE